MMKNYLFLAICMITILCTSCVFAATSFADVKNTKYETPVEILTTLGLVDGYDDGTPYSFWGERSIKALRKEEGTQKIIDLFYKISSSINQENADDVNEYKNRFNSSFLTFCQRNLYKKRFRNRDTDTIDVEKLLFAYVKKEKRLEAFAKINVASTVVSFFISLAPVIIAKLSEEGINISDLWYLIPIGINFLGAK